MNPHHPPKSAVSSVSGAHGQPAGGLLALMSGPYGPVTQLPVDKERRISVHFRLPFLTKWGQTLVVTGSGESGTRPAQPQAEACSQLPFMVRVGLGWVAAHSTIYIALRGYRSSSSATYVTGWHPSLAGALLSL